jgi:tetraacyldisaccharide 4'-kinase
LKDNKLKNKIIYKTMCLNPEILINLKTGEKRKISQLVSKKVIAVSGIGNPKRFFHSLENLGYEVIEKAFPDHYTFKEEDLKFNEFLPIIMTEKDAVKCRSFAKEYMWYLEINAHLDNQFFNKIIKQIKDEE